MHSAEGLKMDGMLYLQVGDALNLRVAGQVEVLLGLKDTLCSSNPVFQSQTLLPAF